MVSLVFSTGLRTIHLFGFYNILNGIQEVGEKINKSLCLSEITFINLSNLTNAERALIDKGAVVRREADNDFLLS